MASVSLRHGLVIRYGIVQYQLKRRQFYAQRCLRHFSSPKGHEQKLNTCDDQSSTDVAKNENNSEAKQNAAQIDSEPKIMQKETSVEPDFFGIINDSEVVTVPANDLRMLSQEELFDKYESLTRKEKTDKIFLTNFGKIRLDNDNRPRSRFSVSKNYQSNSVLGLSEETQNKAIGNSVIDKFEKVDKVKKNRKTSAAKLNQNCDPLKEEEASINKSLPEGYTILSHNEILSEGLEKNNSEPIIKKEGTQKNDYFQKIFNDAPIETGNINSVETKSDPPAMSDSYSYFDSEYFEDYIERIKQKGDSVLSEVDMKTRNTKDGNAPIAEPKISEQIQSEFPNKMESYVDEVYFEQLIKQEANANLPEILASNVQNSSLQSVEINDLDGVKIENQYVFDTEKIENTASEIELSSIASNSHQGISNSNGDEGLKKLPQVDKMMSDTPNDQRNKNAQHRKDFEQEMTVGSGNKITQANETRDQSLDTSLETAFDYVVKRRREKIKNIAQESSNKPLLQDAKNAQSANDESTGASEVMKGKPVSMVLNLQNQPEHVVLKLLKSSILFNNAGIVALNKPYGLICQIGDFHHHYLQKYLPELAKFVDKENPKAELYPLHRLDVGTTGVLLLAKDQRTANIVCNLFKNRKIQKTYWAITKGVPSPAEGIINIPIGEGSIDGRTRMTLIPEFDQNTAEYLRECKLPKQTAITHYRVLSSHDNAALIELHPKTGSKHQLRVHLGFGLGCPILGDHKYSNLTKLAPQRLPGDMLHRLQVRQSKVRDLPIHLHSRSVVIPELVDGRNVFVQAALPKHFKWALKKLKLNHP